VCGCGCGCFSPSSPASSSRSGVQRSETSIKQMLLDWCRSKVKGYQVSQLHSRSLLLLLLLLLHVCTAVVGGLGNKLALSDPTGDVTGDYQKGQNCFDDAFRPS